MHISGKSRALVFLASVFLNRAGTVAGEGLEFWLGVTLWDAVFGLKDMVLQILSQKNYSDYSIGFLINIPPNPNLTMKAPIAELPQ